MKDLKSLVERFKDIYGGIERESRSPSPEIAAAILCVGFGIIGRLTEIRDAIREAKTQDE